MVVGGYDAVFKALAAALGDAIHLGTPVAEVRVLLEKRRRGGGEWTWKGRGRGRGLLELE